MTTEDDDDKNRLAKVIARSGKASRREAERLIEEGRVKVNGAVVRHPGHPVNPQEDQVRLDGELIPAPPRFVYYLFFKPRGLITTRDDPEGRRTVFDIMGGLGTRVEPVGRLDMDTEGALLFTNDGELAHKLTHPSTGVPKRYLAKIYRTPDDKTLKRLERGITLEDGRTAPCKVRVLETTSTGNAWMEITVTEGRNRLVRRMFAAVGHPVGKLRRESFATISCASMERGTFRALTGPEIRRLKDIAEGVEPQRAGKKPSYRKGFAKPKPKPNKPRSKKGPVKRRSPVKKG